METRTVYDDLPGNWLPPAGLLGALWFLAACLLSRNEAFSRAGVWLRPENAATEALALAVVCLLLADTLLVRRRAREQRSFEAGQMQGWCQRGIEWLECTFGSRRTCAQAREGVLELTAALNRQLDLRWLACYFGPLLLLPLPAALLSWNRYLRLSEPVGDLPAIPPSFEVLFGACVWASLTAAALGVAALMLRLRWATLANRFCDCAMRYEDRRFAPTDDAESARSATSNGNLNGGPRAPSPGGTSTARVSDAAADGAERRGAPSSADPAKARGDVVPASAEPEMAPSKPRGPFGRR